MEGHAAHRGWWRISRKQSGRTGNRPNHDHLTAEKIDIDLVPIHNDPDEAGLMGAVHLAPAWMFKTFDAVLGVDIGGTNMRAGVIQLNLKKAPDLSKSKVWKFSLWRHGDEEGVKREHAVDSLVEMLKGLIATANKKGLKLAPFIGIGWRRAAPRTTSRPYLPTAVRSAS